MLRRTVLKSGIAALATGVAGCSGDGTDGADPPATTAEPTETAMEPTATTAEPTEPVSTEPVPTEPGDVVALEYFIQNEDDRSHPLTVTIENGNEEVVQERSDPEFAPGEQLTDRSTGYDPEKGPYPITIALESLSITIEWTPETCPEFNLLVVVDADGQLEVEREACIK